MTTLFDAFAAAALGTALIVLIGTRSWRLALQILLDLLTAAGLLRLVGGPTFPELAVVAAVVALRVTLARALGLRSGGPAGNGHRYRQRPAGTGCHAGHCWE